MSEFYDVHCTNCGKVIGADKMAIDVDLLLRNHLDRIIGTKKSVFLQEAKRIFDEIKIGMYLTKFRMVNDGILDKNGILRLDCEYVLKFIEQKYRVKISGPEEVQNTNDDDTISSFADLDKDFKSLNSPGRKKKFEVSEEILDSLCLKMSMYAQVDSKVEQKRKFVKDLIHLLWNNRNEVVLECYCSAKIKKDDKGNDFISSVHVTYIDDTVEVYSHMVCPVCGEAFYAEAGCYEEHVIVMLGSSRVGKTAYLAALVDEISPEFGQPKYPMISIKGERGKRYTFFKDNILKQYRAGEKIGKTDEGKETVPLFSLGINVSGKQCIFTFVDLPGEVFVPRNEREKESGEASGEFIINHRKICHSADAFWFCIDPIQIDQRLDSMNEKLDMSDKVEKDMSKVLENIENALNIMGDEKLNAATAVIVTKSDLIVPEANLYFGSRREEPQYILSDGRFLINRFQNIAINVKSYLESNNVKNILPRVNNMFKNKNYFAVAAYGVNVEKGSTGTSKAPSAIMLPFLWTLSALGYVQPVKYVQRIEKVGFLKREERIIESYESVNKEQLFY